MRSTGQFIINHHEGACLCHAEAHRPRPRRGKPSTARSNACNTPAVEEVRQGKYFQLTLRAMETADARSEVERIAREVLTNPVIEEFTYHLED